MKIYCVERTYRDFIVVREGQTPDEAFEACSSEIQTYSDNPELSFSEVVSANQATYHGWDLADTLFGADMTVAQALEEVEKTRPDPDQGMLPEVVQ